MTLAEKSARLSEIATKNQLKLACDQNKTVTYVHIMVLYLAPLYHIRDCCCRAIRQSPRVLNDHCYSSGAQCLKQSKKSCVDLLEHARLHLLVRCFPGLQCICRNWFGHMYKHSQQTLFFFKNMVPISRKEGYNKL